MNTSDGARKPATQTTNMSTEPLLGTGGAVNYAIALQQYHFQQSLASQQLLAQQQAVAQAVSIKAATEQAAARAAEISRLLKGETGDGPKEKIEEHSSKREKSVSKSHSQSPSPSHSSKSKSASPVRYRNGRNESEQYSPRDRRHFRGHRNRSYYSRGFNDCMDYSRSSYRRDVDRSRGRNHPFCRRSRSPSQSRRRSASRSLSRRHYHESRFPSPRHVRSPSPKSDRRTPDRGLNEHIMPRNPINDCSISSSPQRSRTRSPRKPTSRSLSGNSQSHSTSSFPMKYDGVDDDRNRSKSNNASGVGLKCWVKEASPSEEQSMQSSRSNPSCRSESTSIDYSIKKTKLEQRSEKTGASETTSAEGDHSSSTSSDSMVVGRRSQDHVNPKVRFSSPEYSHSDHGGQNSNSNSKKAHTFSDKHVTKDIHPSKVHADRNLKLKNRSEHKLPSKLSSSKEEELRYSLDTDTNKRSMKLEIDRKNCSEDVITAEDTVNDCNKQTKQQATIYGVKIFEEQPNVSGGHVAHHLLNSNDNIHGNCMLPNSPSEINHDHEHDTLTPAMLPDGSARETEPAMGSPTVCLYPQERSKKRSSSRERRKKPTRKSHRRHRIEDSEEDDEHGKERKLRRHRRRNHRKHHRSHKERKRKRKHGETSPSSSSEDDSSSDDDCGKEYGHVPSKRPTNSSKRRRHSQSTTSSSD